MKKNFKLKALVLSMVVMMGLTLVPSLYAANLTAFQNKTGRTAENSAVNMSYNAVAEGGKNISSLQPGDTFWVVIDVTKVPESGLASVSNRIAFNSDVVAPVMAKAVKDGREFVLQEDPAGTYPYIEIGDVAYDLGLGVKDPSVVAVDGQPSNIKQISFNCAKPTNPVDYEENFAKIKFVVKDNPSQKDAQLMLLPDGEPYNGFACAAIDPATGETDSKTTFYVTSNLSEVQVPVLCTNVAFDGVTSVELDVNGTNTKDVSGNVKLTPANCNEDMTWTSSNTNVATVSNGVIRAVGTGSATITVTCGTQTATLPVSVIVTANSVSFKNSKYTLDVTQTKNMRDELNIGPEGGVINTLTYASSDPTIASVDANGVVTANKYGAVTLTATLNGTRTATTTVSVVVPLTTISLDKTSDVVWKGETIEVKVTPGPEGAEMATLQASPRSGAECSNADANVAAEKVTITGVTRGTTVYDIYADGSRDAALNKQFSVEVKENRITGAVIGNEAGAEILRGETLEMNGSYTTEVDEATVHATTDDNTMTWSIDNTDVATIDPKTGVVTAVKEGTATVTLTVAGKTATYVVTVKEIHVDGVVIAEEDLAKLKEIEELTIGDKIVIPFTVTPEGIITDTVEEILAYITAKYDKDLVDVKVKFDKETGKGKVTLTVKKAGDVVLTVFAGDPEEEDSMVLEFAFKAVEPVVEETETGDMNVMMLVALMAVCGAGVVTSKKILVK